MKEDIFLRLSANIKKVGPDGIPFPLQAMTRGADGVEDRTAGYRCGLQGKRLGGLSQGLWPGGDRE